jgi:hypothetical protein
MKKNLFLIFMIFVFGCNPTGIEKTVSIINYKDSTGGEPQLINTGIHKDKDVEIFKIAGSEIYCTIMYRVEKGELKAYETDQRSKNNYDKATYRWVNDSTLSFKYTSSLSDSTVSYLMTGNNGWNSLERTKQDID